MFGGGDSHLYGVEGPLYYLYSGLLNFNGIWLLALAFPLLVLTELGLQYAQSEPSGLNAAPTAEEEKAPPRRPIASPFAFYAARLLVILTVVAPVYVWTGALSLLPHKEERFLYVVYPLICLAGALTVQMGEVFLRSVLRVPTSAVNRLVTAGLTVTVLLSVSRTMGLLMHYSAPMQVWAALPSEPARVLAKPVRGFDAATSVVCVGGEWYRYPSSFFLPSSKYRLGFLKSSFDGMLPTHFDEEHWPFRGTRSAPAHLNDRNREHPLQYIEGLDHCSYLVQLAPAENYLTPETQGEWKMLGRARFLNATASPSLAGRVLWMPGPLGEKQNVYSTYQLFERVAAP